MPNFISDGDPSTPFGARKYLWGNMPALDVLNCAQNEGGGLPKDLRLLFAGKYSELVLHILGELIVLESIWRYEKCGENGRGATRLVRG